MHDSSQNESKPRLLRRVSLLLSLVSLGALASACAVGGPDEAPTRGGVGGVAKTKQAIAGTDGKATISVAGTVVNRYTTFTASPTTTTIQVGSVAALAVGADALAKGDLLLVVQMQGATIATGADDTTWGSVTALNGAGLYEFVEVLSVDSGTNTITLSCALKNTYSAAGHVQVVRVPQYDTLLVDTGASIVAPAWNGSVGGVVAIHANSTVTLTGDINVNSLGFRGGETDDNSASAATDVTIFASASAADGARKGEGIAGVTTQFGRGPAANGGGGGNSHNGGGGGGANARLGAAWTGQGVFDLTVKGGATAWLLDPNFSAKGSEGGGRGGYSYSANDANATTTAPGKAAWGGNNRRQRGGLGGHPVDNDPSTRLFLGGGGGAGDGNNGHAGRGGNGGGMVIVMASGVSGTGRILANGEAGVSANSTAGGSASGDSPGGGGGGGTVVVRATTVSGVSVQAHGGGGGSQIINNGDEAEGPGGGGGGGFVSVSSAITVDVAGGSSGTTDSPALTEFPANGATVGSAGQALLGAAAVGTVPYCADTTAPTTTIVTKPTNPTTDNTGDFTFTSDDGAATFECRVDGGAFAACTTPFTTTALLDGSHTFEVRAVDSIGNVDATPDSFIWVVDTTAPDTTIATKPANPTSDATGDFTFTSNDITATFECNLDGAGFAACTTPLATAALAQGSHTLAVRAKDAAGNVDATPDSYTWVVDTIAPDTTIATKPTNPSSDTTGDFTFTSNDVTATFECNLDGAGFVACTTPFATISLTGGSHTLAVRAKDAAGNVDATPDSYTWVVDVSAPDTTIASKPSNPSSDATGDFTFTSNDVTATFECNLDGAGFVACVTPLITATLADGSHTLQVRAKNSVGTVDATPDSYTWVVDTTAPNTTIVNKPTNPTTNPIAGFTFTSNDGAATFECKLDAAAFAPCTTPLNTASLPSGSHTFQVRATDAAGNVDATPDSYTWVVNVDTDGDGLDDGTETSIGTDPNDADSDDDGIVDGAETTPGVDSDGDGLINARDPDSDNDGILDGTEAGVTTAPTGTDVTKGHFVPDADPTTKTDPLDADTDNGGVRDGIEDPNHNGKIDSGERDPNDAADDADPVVDTDSDGLSDATETAIGSNPNDADSDDDGVPDGAEPNYSDDTDGDGLINVLDPDSDNDGLFDGTELGLDCSNPGTLITRHLCIADADAGATKTSPLDPDTDRGGVRDGSEDSNLNGRVDSGEKDPTAGHGADDSTVVDTDGDGISDGTEGTLGTDPNDADTDDDGVRDGDEPNPSADGDSDGLIDVLDVDSDNDGLFDGTELGKNCNGAGTSISAGHCRADVDPSTHTSAVNPDTDGGGVRDGSEDANLDGRKDASEADPTSGHGADDSTVVDTDGDGLSDGTEGTLGSDPNDKDTDDDGLLDGDEPNPGDDNDADGDINILDTDSDDDGLFDGTEAGKNCANPATDTSKNQCVADADTGQTTTWVLVSDTDHGGVSDGVEDTNHDGARGAAERNPLEPRDDSSTGEGGAGGGGAGGEGGEGGTNGGEGGGEAGAPTQTGGTASTGGASTGGSAGSGGTSGGTGGTTGGAPTGGAPTTGGTATGGAPSGGSAGAAKDPHVVILGGGLCSFRPASSGGTAALLATCAVALAAIRRRRQR
jgi:hypothetical protein